MDGFQIHNFTMGFLLVFQSDNFLGKSSLEEKYLRFLSRNPCYELFFQLLKEKEKFESVEDELKF